MKSVENMSRYLERQFLRSEATENQDKTGVPKKEIYLLKPGLMQEDALFYFRTNVKLLLSSRAF